MATVSASDVSDLNDNQNYLSIDENLENEDLGIQSADLETVNSDPESGDSTDQPTDSNVDPSSGSQTGSSDSQSQVSSDEGDSSETTKSATTIVPSSSKVVNGKDYSVTLKDKDGKVLSGKKLIFTFNGKTYTKTTDSKGIASLAISAKAGNYPISVTFEGDDLYEGSSSSNTVTVSKTPTSIAKSTGSAVKGKTFSVILKDGDGKALASKSVTITFNGKTYKRTTNAKGLANITITGVIGNYYTMSFKYAGSDYYAASSGSERLRVKMPTNFLVSETSVVKGSSYVVTLRNSNKKALSNKAVSFIIDGKTYSRTTNKKGVASIKLNLAMGKTHNITSKYAGSSYYGASSKTVSVFVKTPTKLTNSGASVASGKSYIVTLTDSNGKALSGRSVKLVYRGKTYKKTTNAKGQVSLKITAGLGNRYKMTYKYGGCKTYGPSSGSVTIRVKMGTTLTGPSSKTILKGSQYNVTLKDANGKKLSNQPITFKLDGTTYNRTTNSKGIAILTIKKAAGKTYKISYTYAGTTYYNKTTSGNIDLAVKISSTIKNSGTSMLNGTLYNVTLKDADAKVLSNKAITFTLDGKTYKNNTNDKGVASLLISENAPKTTKLTYKFAGDATYTASSGSVSINVISDKVFTFDHIMTGAKNLRSHVEKNGLLPSAVTLNTIRVDIPTYSYLLSKAIQEANSGKKGNIAIIDIDPNYTNNGSTKIKADLNKDGYMALINTLINKSETNGKIPSYITTGIGNVSPNLYIFGLSKVLDFYRLNNRLPNYVTLNAKDVDGSATPDVDKKGNASQYKKGLNEVQSLSAAELAKYLTASGNDALNAEIKALAKQLTQGKTTTWAKAQAIFNYVRDNIDYEYYANTKYKATGTLSKKRGNCCDHANLVVALCRAADIPARFSHAKNCRFRSGLVTGHVWAQIYVDGVWYTADATSKSNQLGNIQNWNTNSFTNLNQYIHLAF